MKTPKTPNDDKPAAPKRARRPRPQEPEAAPVSGFALVSPAPANEPAPAAPLEPAEEPKGTRPGGEVEASEPVAEAGGGAEAAQVEALRAVVEAAVLVELLAEVAAGPTEAALGPTEAGPGPTEAEEVGPAPTEEPQARSTSSVDAPYGSTARYRELEALGDDALEVVFLRGTTPDLAKLVGWEFRGTNVPGWARLLGIKKFIKGFWREGEEVLGYNCPVVQNSLFEPWDSLPSNLHPKRFGFYKVTPVDATAKDNRYLHAALLNYGEGPNPPWEPARGLRDYLVQVDPDNPDLYLGKAFYALGPLRVATNFFLLERHRLAPR
jgi:hypothetical protein